MRFFLFGSLMDPDVAGLVLGRTIDTGALRPAVLHGYKRLVVAGESYPALAARPGGAVAGVLMADVNGDDLARMQFFESEEFVPAECEVELAYRRFVSAHTFLASEQLEYSDRPWDYLHWRHHEKPGYLAMVRAWMAEYGRRAPRELEAAWACARREQVDAERCVDANETETTRGGKSHE